MGFFTRCTALFLATSALFNVIFASALPPLVDNKRHFVLTLTWEKISPDGVERDMFLVNGQFPGPLLEMNEGDDVVILVKNESPYNATIHYHGIEMMGTPWSDGVPGISQNHIQPGCAFTQRWKATQRGTFFYHSHSESQVNDGLYGPIVIHPALNTPKPYSMITEDPVSLHAIELAEKRRIPMVLSDWRHITSDKEWEISEQSHIEHICFDSILINGKGNVNCLSPEEQPALTTPGQAALLGLVPGAKLTTKSCLPPDVLAAIPGSPGALPVDLAVIPPDLFNKCTATTGSSDMIEVTKTKCEAEKWIMLDLIGTFGLHTVQVSLDELTMWVVAADANYVEPTAANSILVANGQRYTVLVKLPAEGPSRRYTFRVSSVSDPQILFATSTIDYRVQGSKPAQVYANNTSASASTPWINVRGVNLTSDVVFFDPSAVKPFQPAPIPRDVDKTYKFTMQIDGNNNQWAFNVTRDRDLDTAGVAPPLLFAPRPGLQDNHTITVPSEASWVDYVMQVPVGQPPHPVHAHGRHFYVLGQGSGAFKWDSVAEAVQDVPELFNLVNPPLRDTFPTPASSLEAAWLVLRRPSDNPGVWFLHCHIMSHLQGGMSMVIQDGTDDLPEIPKEFLDWSCQA
ncbi:Uu.00g142080.m01.CDS01 [Anthostomella pinea]|uniref:Uu.00g142080.m01.CDS01 n=1 Tax=Anthostomella pinea TaxID=933095 RepID=A0AAI8YLI1_9PEZI|nr:Uu.00g142080.m01.CDS01 [Anthostomella pinea]